MSSSLPAPSMLDREWRRTKYWIPVSQKDVHWLMMECVEGDVCCAWCLDQGRWEDYADGADGEGGGVGYQGGGRG